MILNQTALLKQFAKIGIDMRDSWVPEAFQERHDADLEEWVAANARDIPPESYQGALNVLSTSLLAAGEMTLSIRLKAAAEAARKAKVSTTRNG